MQRSQKGVPGGDFIDFVCECGAGKRHFVNNLVTHGAKSIPPGESVADLPLIRANLRCGQACVSPAIVYAVAANNGQEPSKPFKNWNLSGVTCGDGNPISTVKHHVDPEPYP
jgi:hypothetical protein